VVIYRFCFFGGCFVGAKQVNEISIRNEPAINSVILRRGSLHLVSQLGSIGASDWSFGSCAKAFRAAANCSGVALG
jgi:hypothetical protein